MQFDRQYHPEACTSDDDARPQLCNVLLDVEHKRLVATDGHTLTVIPIAAVEPEDTTGVVQPVAFKHARKVTPKRAPTLRVQANGHVECGPAGDAAIQLARVKLSDREFPPYEVVLASGDVPPDDADVVTVGLSVHLLLRIATAIGAVDDGRGIVRLRIRKTEEMVDPIRVDRGSYGPDAAFGLLMPCRT